LCTNDDNKNNLKKPRARELEEAIKAIFKDSYTDINEEIADKLPIGNDYKDKAKRRLMWHAFDVN
jgi:hypothetical protein